MDPNTQNKMRELMAVAKRAFDVRLQTGTGGNISIRLQRNDRVVIKPSGVGFAECSEHNLLVVDLEGHILDGDAKPSKDMPFHLGIYRVRPEVNGIVHVHSPWATAWAAAGHEIPAVTIQARSKLGRIPLIPVGPDGGNQTPESIIEAFRDATLWAALLESHGSVSVGKNLLAAEHLAELVEETAHIAAVARALKAG
ncbi:MAG: class II aldolase/adducin family protein [Desulfobacterales bacterium]|nr:MAG: class II aldolase/adducin family protein [Desulfobacterales bacterium]